MESTSFHLEGETFSVIVRNINIRFTHSKTGVKQSASNLSMAHLSYPELKELVAEGVVGNEYVPSDGITRYVVKTSLDRKSKEVTFNLREGEVSIAFDKDTWKRVISMLEELAEMDSHDSLMGV